MAQEKIDWRLTMTIVIVHTEPKVYVAHFASHSWWSYILGLGFAATFSFLTLDNDWAAFFSRPKD